MTRAAPRTHFDRSGLIRSLAGLADTAAATPPPLAARLGDWLDFNDAMLLFAALNGSKAAGVPTLPAHELGATLARERDSLAEAIHAATTPGARTRIKWPQPDPEAPEGATTDYAPYHRYYLAQQREIEIRSGHLRSAVRDALAACKPALRQLAALDAAFDKALGPRERSLLAKVPLVLEKRFAQLRDAAPTGDWLAIFAREMRDVLLAELETRLAPVTGLIETLSNEEAGQG